MLSSVQLVFTTTKILDWMVKHDLMPAANLTTFVGLSIAHFGYFEFS
jgi:hypothetical protein